MILLKKYRRVAGVLVRANVPADAAKHAQAAPQVLVAEAPAQEDVQEDAVKPVQEAPNHRAVVVTAPGRRHHRAAAVPVPVRRLRTLPLPVHPAPSNVRKPVLRHVIIHVQAGACQDVVLPVRVLVMGVPALITVHALLVPEHVPVATEVVLPVASVDAVRHVLMPQVSRL